MGPHGIYEEGIQDFIFAALFVLTAVPLARFLHRRTHCYSAAMLVGLGMFSAAVGLTFLGIAALKYISDIPEMASPFAAAALICQLGGAGILSGALVFTTLYSKKLISAGARDPSLRSSPLGLRFRRLDEAS